MKLELDHVVSIAKGAIEIEIAGLSKAQSRLGPEILAAVSMILGSRGRAVVMGMGKSGHIGRKIAATLSSTGTPAMFVHPGEASHGDLGMVTSDDVVIALSNSGESNELGAILPILKRLGTPILAITGVANSSLARQADVVLDSSVDCEACPLNLAPTASTTVQLALGDALAVALLDARGFKAEDFARSHPGGSLGRRLLTHVRDVMRAGDSVPKVDTLADFSATMRKMGSGGLGATAVVDQSGRPVGIFTDGDLRRRLERGDDVRLKTAGELMSANPRTLSQDVLAAEAAFMMESCGISCILLVDGEGVLAGAVSANDLMRAKII
jgi:arabinose-5-phosphate isomerase